MPLWRTGGVPCGTEVMSPPYARAMSSSTSLWPHQIDHHRVVANRCRAQASSMPEGPAIGRVEAKRRALTTPSTAPASSARWWRGSIRAPNRGHVLQKNRLVREPIAAEVTGTSSLSIWHEHGHAGGAILLHGSGRADSDTRHDQRWRERPRQGALGSGAGHDSGVVHAIVRAVTSARALLDEAAESAASSSCARQRTPLQAFACGSRSSATRGERGAGEGVETGGPT